MDNIAEERNWVGEYDNCPPCYYNENVGCDSRLCENCGWNPFVSLTRIVTKYGKAAADYLTTPGS